MKNKNVIKLLLDIVLTVLFITLIYPKTTGFTFHEIAGLTIGALFTFHVILNWNWVKGVTKNMFNPKLKAGSRWKYILDIVSFISVLAIIITGIEISKVLFPGGAGNNHTLTVLHKWVAYFCLGLFGVHIVVHWRFIRDAVRKLAEGLKLPRLGKAALGAGASALVLYMLYAQAASGLGSDEDRTATRRGHQSGNQTQIYESVAPQGVNSSPSAGTSSSSPQGTGSSSSIGTGSSGTQTDTGSGKSSSLSGNSTNSSDSVSLTDYLGKMFCNGCDKHCSLLNLQCDKGTRYLQQAQAQYQQLYGTTATVD